MQSIAMPTLAIVAAYAYAAGAGALLGRHWAQRHAFWLALPLATTPLLVPAEHIRGRAVVAFLAIDLALKIMDYGRELRSSRAWSWPDYLRLLPPFPILLVRTRDRRALDAPMGRPEVLRAFCTGTLVVVIFAAMIPLNRVDWIQENFLLDHAVKVALFVLLMEAGSHLAHSVERLLGYDTTRPMRDFYLSLTPAEFWLRYNTRIHSWLEANVYRPCGGGIRGVLAVFLFSAAFHELAFDIATSHLDGYQFTFFMLQAPAVIASPWLKRIADRYGKLGHGVVRGLTIVWFYFTSMLFFRGVERIFPIVYGSEPWLP